MKIRHSNIPVRTRRGLLALAAALSAVLAAQAAPAVKVSAEVDSAVMVMGSVSSLKVTVDMPQGSQVELIDFPILTSGQDYVEYNGVDVVASDSTSAVENGRKKLKFDFRIQAFDPGTVTLPPFAVLPAPGSDTAFSNVVAFKVLPVDVDSLQTINPMASIVAPATRWYDYIPAWLLWLLGAAAVIGGGICAFFALRKHKEEVLLHREPPVPPYELAVSRLTALRQRNLPEQGQEKEYYTELVDILRDYLHGRFGINAMEMTSTQIVKALRSNPDTRMTADEMRSVLSIADFVKFAKVRPLPDDNIKAFNRAQTFVEETKPAPEPEPEVQPEAKTTTKSSTPKTKK